MALMNSGSLDLSGERLGLGPPEGEPLQTTHTQPYCLTPISLQSHHTGAGLTPISPLLTALYSPHTHTHKETQTCAQHTHTQSNTHICTAHTHKGTHTCAEHTHNGYTRLHSTHTDTYTLKHTHAHTHTHTHPSTFSHKQRYSTNSL